MNFTAQNPLGMPRLCLQNTEDNFKSSRHNRNIILACLSCSIPSVGLPKLCPRTQKANTVTDIIPEYMLHRSFTPWLESQKSKFKYNMYGEAIQDWRKVLPNLVMLTNEMSYKSEKLKKKQFLQKVNRGSSFFPMPIVLKMDWNEALLLIGIRVVKFIPLWVVRLGILKFLECLRKNRTPVD